MRPDPDHGPWPGDARSAAYSRPFRRVLVPIESSRATTAALSLGVRMGRGEGVSLRVVHVRAWDAVARGIGRVYSETSEEATRVIDTAMTYAWERGALDASGVVLEARRPNLAATILTEVADWEADLVVLTCRPRPFRPRGGYEKALRAVMRASACPILVVYPGRH